MDFSIMLSPLENLELKKIKPNLKVLFSNKNTISISIMNFIMSFMMRIIIKQQKASSQFMIHKYHNEDIY